VLSVFENHAEKAGALQDLDQAQDVRMVDHAHESNAPSHSHMHIRILSKSHAATEVTGQASQPISHRGNSRAEIAQVLSACLQRSDCSTHYELVANFIASLGQENSGLVSSSLSCHGTAWAGAYKHSANHPPGTEWVNSVEFQLANA
jgi:hypothetical protein